MAEYKTFAPITAVLLAGTVFFEHAIENSHHTVDKSFLTRDTPLPDDSERRMPKWPDQQRLAATQVTTGSVTANSFGWLERG